LRRARDGVIRWAHSRASRERLHENGGGCAISVSSMPAAAAASEHVAIDERASSVDYMVRSMLTFAIATAKRRRASARQDPDPRHRVLAGGRSSEEPTFAVLTIAARHRPRNAPPPVDRAARVITVKSRSQP
jgi:hypothetical protein